MVRRLREDRFLRILLLLVLAAALLRVVFVLTVTRHDDRLYDAVWYEWSARLIAEGGGFFVDPFLELEDPTADEPNADHPPLTVLVLVPGALLGSEEASELAMRFTMVAVGCASVAVVGLLARRLAGDTAGLVAAAIAAVDPNLWMNDGLLMSESIATLLTVAVVYGTYRLLDRPATTWAVALGGIVALAALTRAELGPLGALVVLPALLLTRQGAWLMRGAACAVAFLVVLAPWVAFNLSRFEEPTTISTGLGLALRSGNCPVTYHGEYLGWSAVFPPCTPLRQGTEQSVWDGDLRQQALSYMRSEARRVPLVALARVGRIWSVYRVGQTNDLAAGEGRPPWASWLGSIATWLLAPTAVAGGVALRRRGLRIWPLVAALVATSLVVLAFLAGLPRYRAPGEPSLVVLAAVGATALAGSRRSPRGAGGSEAGGDEGATLDGDQTASASPPVAQER